MKSKNFSWVDFGAMFMTEMKQNVIPLKLNGTEPWDGWETVKKLKVRREDLERWVNDKKFGGFALIPSHFNGYFIIEPTIKQIEESIIDYTPLTALITRASLKAVKILKENKSA